MDAKMKKAAEAREAIARLRQSPEVREMAMESQMEIVLEVLVDEHGLSTVVGLLADLALAKEDQSQDKDMSKRWNKAGVILLSTQQRIIELLL